MNWLLRLTSDVQRLLLSLYVLQKGITLMMCRFRPDHRHREQGKGWRDLQSDSLHDHLNISGAQRRENTDDGSGWPSRIPYIELQKCPPFPCLFRLIRDLCPLIAYRARFLAIVFKYSRDVAGTVGIMLCRNTYWQNAFSSPASPQGSYRVRYIPH